MNAIVDLRCPCCNSIVIGHHPVVSRIPAKLPANCPKCKTAIEMKKGPADDLGDANYNFVCRR